MTEVRRVRVAVVSAAAALVLASCGESGETAGDDAPAEEETVTEGPTPDPTPNPTPSPSPAPGAGTPQARLAVADLAQRLGVADSEIAVRSVEAVTWRDGSLGCAEKGMAYTQALVEGSRITLEVEGRAYEYHAAGQRAPFYCARPTQ
jgi:hypothetical protein